MDSGQEMTRSTETVIIVVFHVSNLCTSSFPYGIRSGLVVLILNENVAASVGSDTALHQRQHDLESSLEGREPGRFQYRCDRVTVERLTEFPRQNAALDRQQVVVGRLS